jgi:uncharacterized membrane protein
MSTRQIRPKPTGRLRSTCLVAAMITTVGAVALAPGVSADTERCDAEVIDLGTLGGARSAVIAVNSRRVWVGRATDADEVSRAVLWRHGRIVDLGVEGDAWAADINNRGDVVGNSKESDDWTTARAFRWSKGVATELPGLAPDAPTFVRRLNQRGVAVGSASNAEFVEIPVMWPADGGNPIPLPIPDGFDGGYAMGINDRGDVVGAVYAEFSLVAWGWDADGTNHVLAELDLDGFSQANVLDNKGRAAGLSDFGGNPGGFAALWHRGHTRSLGVFGESDYSFALGTNGQGDYVGQGSYFVGEDNAHVFLTSASSTGPLRSLLPLSGDPADWSSAHAVTSGKVAVGGDSETASGEAHATVWTCAYQQAFVPDLSAIGTSASPAPDSDRRQRTGGLRSDDAWAGRDRGVRRVLGL